MKIKIAAFGLLALAVGGISAARAEAPLTRADVEKIVAEYIAAHPQDIMAAVQKHQEDQERVAGLAAVQQNGDDLYKDAATPVVGDAKADVTVVEFFDYNCGYCKKVTPTVVNVAEGNKNVRLLFKEYPILGPSSEMAAKWALAAQRQGKYFEFHKRLMTNAKPITETFLNDIAKDLGMDVVKAKSDAYGTEIMMEIERNRALAGRMGIRGTPAFVIGGEVVPGAIDEDTMHQMIEQARAAAKKPG